VGSRETSILLGVDPLGYLAPQCSHFLKSRCHIAQEGGDPDDPSGLVAERHDREFDGDPAPVFSRARHGQAFAGAIVATTAI
jgi:hypothetical protein